ncbi:hypothetical protein Tco_1221625 [Tanacetum coccineum]
MDGMIDEDDESSNEGWKRWGDFEITNRDNEESFSILRIPVYGYGALELAAKKSTKLVKYRSSGILCVIVVMLEYRRIHNTHPCL